MASGYDIEVLVSPASNSTLTSRTFNRSVTINAASQTDRNAIDVVQYKVVGSTTSSAITQSYSNRDFSFSGNSTSGYKANISFGSFTLGSSFNSDTIISINVKVFDKSSEIIAETDSFNVRVPSATSSYTKPTVSITSSNSSTTSSSVTVSGSYTCDSSLSVSSIKLTRTDCTSSSTTYTATVNTSSKTWSCSSVSLNYGSNSFSVTITDSQSQTATATSSRTRTTTSSDMNLSVDSPSSSTTTVSNSTTSYTISGGIRYYRPAFTISSVKINDSSVTLANSGSTSSVGWNYQTFSKSVSLSVGSNTITVVGKDSNDVTSTITRTITRESPSYTKPTISRTVLSSSTTSSSVTFKGTYTIDSSLSVSSIKIYNSNTGTTTSATVTSSSKSWTSTISLGYGRNDLTATITDSSGATATCTDYISRNTSSPTIIWTSPSSTSTSVANGTSTYTISGSATASTSTYPISSVTVNGTSVSLTTSSTTKKTFSTSVNLAVGSNTITIVATDSYGTSTTATRTIVRNPVAPTITITSSPPTSTTNSVLSLSGGYTAGSSYKSIIVHNTSSNTQKNAVVNTTNKTWSYTNFPLVYGTNNFTVTITDDYDQTASKTFTITRDTPVPTLSVTSPSSTSLNVSNSTTSYTLSGTATAGSSDYPISSVTVNGNAATLTAGSGNTKNWSYSATNLALGNNYFSIVATDSYGTSSSTTRTIKRLTNLTASKSASVNYTNNTITFSGTVSTSSGYTISSATLHLKAPNSSSYTSYSATLTSTSSTYSSSWKYIYTFDSLATGTYSYYLTATDSMGNSGTWSTGTVNVTEPAPTINVSAANNGAVTNQKVDRVITCTGTVYKLPVTFAIYENGSLLGETSVDENGNTIITSTGSYDVNMRLTPDVQGHNEYYIVIKDGNGKTATSGKFWYTYSTQTPNLTFPAPTTPVTNSTTSVNISGTCGSKNTYTYVNYVSVNYTKPNGTTAGFGLAGAGSMTSWEFSGDNTIPLDVGTTTIVVTATDNAGNTTSITRTVTRTVLPTITWTTPSATSLSYGNGTSSISCSGAFTKDSAVTVSNIKISGTSMTVSTSTWSGTRTLSVGVGSYTATITDSLGQTASVTKTITRKYASPTVAITYPTNGLCTKNSPITLTGTITLPSGATAPSSSSCEVSGTQYNLTNTTLTPSSLHALATVGQFSNGVATFTANITPPSDAVNYSGVKVTFVASGYDSAESSAINFTYSNRKPTVTVTEPSGTITVYKSSYTVKGTCLPGIGTNYVPCSVMCNNIPQSIENETRVPTTPTSWTQTITLAVGLNTITVYAVDQATNMSTTITRNITYKDIQPYCNVTADFDGLVTNVIEMRQFQCLAGSPDKVKYLRCYENGKMIGDAQSGGDFYEGNYTLGIACDKEGKNEYYIQMEDYAGNTVNSNKFYVTYSTKGPVVTIVSPEDGGMIEKKITVDEMLNGANSDTTTLSAKVTSGASYLSTSSITIDGETKTVTSPTGTTTVTKTDHTMIPGTNTWLVTASNNAGNTTSKTATFLYAPYTDPVISREAYTVRTNGGSAEFGEVTPSENAQIKVYIYSILDADGNPCDGVENITLASSDGKTFTNVTLDKLDLGGGNSLYTIPLSDYNVVNTNKSADDAPRDITVSMTVTTTHGCTATRIVANVMYYTGGINIIFDNSSPMPIVNTNMYKITGKVTHSYGDNRVLKVVDDDEPVSITSIIDPDTFYFEKLVELPIDGLYEFTFYMTDEFGTFNSNQFQIRKFTQPPLIEITAPKEGLITNDIDIASHVVGKVKPAANFVSMGQVLIEGVRYLLGDTDDDGYYVIDKMITTIIEGPNTVIITASDNIGNIATIERHVRLDTKSPMIRDVVTDSISIDSSGVIHITLKVIDPD